jgi:hypothetical protein
MHSTVKCIIGLLLLVVLVAGFALEGHARMKYIDPDEAARLPQRQLSKTAVVPNTTLAVHNVGNFYFSVTNWGFFGSQAGDFSDPKTGQPAPGAEFPAGSKIDYLFQGALWISALVGIDTLTSTGHDGWLSVSEMYPESADNGGVIIERSNRPGSEFYSPEAISEQDFIAVYTDTLTDQTYVNADQYTGPHVPLHIKITQKSYSWSYSYAQDFVLLDFIIENIGLDSLRQLYMGLYIDADVYHSSRRVEGFADDICGFRNLEVNPSGAIVCGGTDVVQDTVNIAWIADNDGDQVGGIFDFASPKAVTGTRVVRSPTPPGGCGPTRLDYSFNWWNSHGTPSLDWGPQKIPGDLNFSGGRGTPDGDTHKYRVMSNREFDYDQVYSAEDMSAQGWMPPHESRAATFADGYDTRYLLSFGPFSIGSGQSLPVTVGYIAGDDFHNDPDNIRNLPDAPNTFYENLDFTDLAVNARWAAWVFDNPGFSTPDPETGVADECRGLYYLANCSIDSIDGSCIDCDTIWYAGDGIPDYQGPPPPNSPILDITALPGKVIIEWDGSETETRPDAFSFLKDFEGYRLYMADLDQVASFALVASWDMVDFRAFREDVAQPQGSEKRWMYKDYPLTLDELRAQFNDPDFEPTDYPSPSKAYTDTTNGQHQRYYFEVEDWNRGNEYDENGITIQNLIQRVAVVDSIDELGNPISFGRYHFEIDGLLPSQSYYFAVTAFDYGYPQNGLQPLESSPLVNSQLVFPFYSADVVEEQNLEISAYPNPYIVSDDYRSSQYEDPYRQGWTERDRRIHFVNLPSRAMIKIYTLDGDLVREFEHYEGGPFSDTSSKAYWDLISRNTQAVVSGIYLYTVESSLGTQIGKLVIVK